MTRQAANYEILNKLYAAVEQHPDWRFHQILQNLNISLPHVDQFYEESEETLKRVEPAINNIQDVYEIKD